MKKNYYIREGSPMAKLMNVLPIIAIAAVIVIGGLLNSSDLGLL